MHLAKSRQVNQPQLWGQQSHHGSDAHRRQKRQEQASCQRYGHGGNGPGEGGAVISGSTPGRPRSQTESEHFGGEIEGLRGGCGEIAAIEIVKTAGPSGKIRR